jgi:hypothetical protein
MPGIRTLSVAVTATLVCAFSPIGSGAAVPDNASSACRRNQYALKIAIRDAPGSVLAQVGIVNTRGPVCVLTTPLHIAIRYQDRSIARMIRNNPAVWHVAARLAPWASFVHTWIWRNWCDTQRRFVVTANAAGNRAAVTVPKPPSCRNRRAPSSLANLGPVAPGPAEGDRIPAHILPPDTPIPLSPALIRVTNGWLVSDGRTLVAVYAGEAGNDPTVGRFVIIRQNLVIGFQTRNIVDVGRIGAVRITEAPSGAGVETSAQRGDLRFSSASGAQGILRLARDSFRLLP